MMKKNKSEGIMTVSLAPAGATGSYNQFDKEKGKLGGKEVTVIEVSGSEEGHLASNKSAIRRTIAFSLIVFVLLAGCITCAVLTCFAPSRNVKTIEAILSIMFGCATLFASAELFNQTRTIKCTTTQP
jgi:hypothetical protein